MNKEIRKIRVQHNKVKIFYHGGLCVKEEYIGMDNNWIYLKNGMKISTTKN